MATNPLASSDEDFLNQQPPEVDPSEKAAEVVPDEAAHNQDDPPEGDEGNDPTPEDKDKDDKSEGDPTPEEGDEADPKDPPAPDPKEETNPDDKPKEPEAKPEPKPVEEVKPKEGDPAPGSDRVFQVPTSFQANGKTVELKDEAEALKLMQMGANYTRKMQELAPHRKVLMMLQNNGLMDETKLSFLIDLDKKNPDAIKQLVKDAGLDPNEIDNEAELNYLAGSHIVTDQEAVFRTVIEDVSSTDKGKETIAILNRDWDKQSKEALWSQPELMTVFHEQRELGVYDKITAEMDRRRTLGTISASMPFLAAYKQVGDEMFAAAPSNTPVGQQPKGATEGQPELAIPAPTPVATRTAAPKADVKSGDKARAASPSRATPGSAKVLVNPLSIPDDQFLKEMENRV